MRRFSILPASQCGMHLWFHLYLATLQAADIGWLLLDCSYDGKVVAKLPFEPWPFFQKITHRGLPGTDPTDAAMVSLPSCFFFESLRGHTCPFTLLTTGSIMQTPQLSAPDGAGLTC